jgi:hypothetical protein
VVLGAHLPGGHTQAGVDQELLDDGVPLDGNAGHRVGKIDRPEHVEELKRHRVADQAVNERVNGGITLSKLFNQRERGPVARIRFASCQERARRFRERERCSAEGSS